MIPFHVGDEKHLISDCPAFDFLHEHHTHLFLEYQTVRGFMKQDLQKGVLQFTCDCLEHDLMLASLVALCRLDYGQRRQQRWWRQHWQRGGGSHGDDGGSSGNAILQLRLQTDEHICGS